MRSVGVVRPIILAFRAEDRGSNPRPSTLLRNELTKKETGERFEGGTTAYELAQD